MARCFVSSIIGVYYNQRKHGLVGTNAIPHIDKWRRYLPLAREYSEEAFNKAIIHLALARALVKRKWDGYKEV
jgi:hypothetical protein